MKNVIKTIPEVISLVNLKCILMPNGKLMYYGKILAWFNEIKEGDITVVSND